MSSTADPGDRVERNPPVTGRRWLLGFMLGSSVLASLAAIFYPLVKFLLPPRTAELDSDSVVAARANELAPNTGKVFRFGNRPGLLVRQPDGAYAAVSAVCTHLNCTVQYRPREHDVWCACHNGVYDLQGRNLGGPPPRPLEQFDVHVQGEDIIVVRRRRA